METTTNQTQLQSAGVTANELDAVDLFRAVDAGDPEAALLLDAFNAVLETADASDMDTADVARIFIDAAMLVAVHDVSTEHRDQAAARVVELVRERWVGAGHSAVS